jgi:hypothetical protein
MDDPIDPDLLARQIGEKFAVEPEPGFQVEADELALPLVTRELSMIAIASRGYYLRLHFWGAADYVIEIEGSSWARPSADTIRSRIEPGSGPYDAVLALLGGTVTEAVATRAGGLRLEFAGGGEFEVDAPGAFETWQLRDENDDDYLLVTHAGGGLLEFGDRPESDSHPLQST